MLIQDRTRTATLSTVIIVDNGLVKTYGIADPTELFPKHESMYVNKVTGKPLNFVVLVYYLLLRASEPTFYGPPAK